MVTDYNARLAHETPDKLCFTPKPRQGSRACKRVDTVACTIESGTISDGLCLSYLAHKAKPGLLLTH